MKIIILLVLSLNLFANSNEDGKELHDETCIVCHISTHNKDFYTNEDRIVDNLFKLKSQVSRCSVFFNTGWFPEEEKSVVNYLNHEFYKFEQK